MVYAADLNSWRTWCLGYVSCITVFFAVRVSFYVVHTRVGRSHDQSIHACQNLPVLYYRASDVDLLSTSFKFQGR